MFQSSSQNVSGASATFWWGPYENVRGSQELRSKLAIYSNCTNAGSPRITKMVEATRNFTIDCYWAKLGYYENVEWAGSFPMECHCAKLGCYVNIEPPHKKGQGSDSEPFGLRTHHFVKKTNLFWAPIQNWIYGHRCLAGTLDRFQSSQV